MHTHVGLDIHESAEAVGSGEEAWGQWEVILGKKKGKGERKKGGLGQKGKGKNWDRS